MWYPVMHPVHMVCLYGVLTNRKLALSVSTDGCLEERARLRPFLRGLSIRLARTDNGVASVLTQTEKCKLGLSCKTQKV
uniref:Uncharacterized protein n=1 Tax=Nothobranchius furzeri TaxID=105023 RepID=A0A8C6VWT3_NOTFU